MSTSVQVNTQPFGLKSLEQINATTLKVSFTNDVLAQNPVNTNDGLNPSNYVLSGTSLNSVVSLNTISTDLTSLTINLKNPLSSGTWTLTVSNVEDIDGLIISTPSQLSIDVLYTPQEAPIAQGASNRSSSDTIKDHITPFFKGKTGWESLIAAIAVGDDYLSDLAQSTYDQLFLSSAVGVYLEKQASDQGFNKPVNVGLSDDSFRELAIKASAEKVTLQSFLKILEIYYGEDALRATVDSTEESYALSDGDDLLINIDGVDVTVTFSDADCTVLSKATAKEVAAIITRAFDAVKLNAYAKPVINTSTSTNFIRIYSGALGLRGSVKVLGGKAQNVLNFSTSIATTQDNTTRFTLDNYASNNAVPPDRIRFTYSAGTDPSLKLVQIGDYANIYGSVFDASNRGAFEIVDSSTTYFEVQNPLGINQTVTLSSASDVKFFRPTLFTLNSKNRFASVTQSSIENKCEITLPATTTAVAREEFTGAYLNSNLYLDIIAPIVPTSVARSANVVTVTTSTNHNLQAGNTFYFGPGDSSFSAGIKTVAAINSLTSFTYNETGSNATLSGTSYISPCYRSNGVVTLTTPSNHGLSAGQQILIDNLKSLVGVQGGVGVSSIGVFGTGDTKQGAAIALLQDGRVLIAGGGSTTPADKNVYTLDPTTNAFTSQGTLSYDLYQGTATTLSNGQVLIVDGNTANTAIAQIFDPSTNSLVSTNAPTNQRQAHTATLLTNGKVLVVGGQNSAGTAINSVEIYDPSTSTWSAGPSLTTARWGHTATLLNNGTVLITGGKNDAGAVVNTCEIYNPTNNLWHTTLGALSVERYDHSATLLDNGKVLLVGGYNNAGTVQATADIYSDATETVSQISIGSALTKHSTAKLTDGKVLIMGGNNGTADVNTVFIYDPRANSVSTSSYTLPQNESELTAIALDNNRVFISCGTGTNNSIFTYNRIVTSSGGLNGLQTIASASLNVLTYKTLETDTTAIDKTATTSIILPFKAPVPQVVGPYIFNPNSSDPSLTSVNTTTTQQIQQNQTNSILNVSNTSGFDTNGGYLILGFGTKNQTGPIKYNSIISSTQLGISSGFMFPYTLDPGISVIKLSGLGAFTPTDPETTGCFYLTDSSAGRIAADKTIDDIAAVGIKVDKTIVYPGTFGLGGGDISTDDAGPKLNDAIYIWGSQDEVNQKRGF